MTKDKLKKEAEEKSIAEYGCKFDGFIRGYLASAEPREKRIADLEAQIEKMKCCVVSHCEGCPGLPKLYEAFDKEIKENE